MEHEVVRPGAAAMTAPREPSRVEREAHETLPSPRSLLCRLRCCAMTRRPVRTNQCNTGNAFMFGKTLRNGKMHPVLNAIDNVYRRTVSIRCDFKGGNDQFAVKCPKRSCVFTCCCGTEEGRWASKHAHNFTAIQNNSKKRTQMFQCSFLSLLPFVIFMSLLFFLIESIFYCSKQHLPRNLPQSPHPGTTTPPTSGPPTQTQTQTQHTNSPHAHAHTEPFWFKPIPSFLPPSGLMVNPLRNSSDGRNEK